MRFDSQVNQDTEWETIIYDQDGQPIYWARTSKNSETHFLAELLIHYNENQAEMIRLMQEARGLCIGCDIASDAQESYEHFIAGFVQFLEQPRSEELRKQYEGNYWLLKRRIASSLNFWHCCRQGESVFLQGGRPLLHVQSEYLRATPSLTEHDNHSASIYRGVLALAFAYRNSAEYADVIEILEHFDKFHQSIPNDDNDSQKAFIDFAHGLFLFVEDERPRLGIHSVTTATKVAAFLLKNKREEFEERKRYLEFLLASSADEISKRKLLEGIVEDIQHDHGNNSEILPQVTSIISSYYLDRYDLDTSAAFWKKLNTPDFQLRLLLYMHTRSTLFLKIVLSVLFGLLGIGAVLNWITDSSSILSYIVAKFPTCASMIVAMQRPMVLLTAGVLGIICLISISLLVLIPLRPSARHLLYSHLFLPRILGASIVGLTPLLLDDLPWKIGLMSDFTNWLLVTLFVYIASFFYIFLEVYNTIRFVPGRSIQDARIETFKIYSISIMQTILIVTIGSCLIYPVISFADRSWGLRVGTQLTSFSPWVSFGFFPSLIILWSGIALFVGSFVQLLWQDRRITSSI